MFNITLKYIVLNFKISRSFMVLFFKFTFILCFIIKNIKIIIFVYTFNYYNICWSNFITLSNKFTCKIYYLNIEKLIEIHNLDV